ncbi:SGNH/GDSL hydrolase family protein [Actinobacteria bacterium IMCC26103]|nr:SGNH/GDSL hydrolase family protein [Actinobacteria bacterium IMCC26103]
MLNPITFAVVGDSAASGVGDSDDHGNHFGWTYHLAKAFHEPLVYINASRPGARSAEVLNIQLPKVLEHTPELAAVIVGGNDLLRSNFSPDIFEKNLRQTLVELVSNGSTIMLLELHDPTVIVPMPYLVGRICRRRVNAVNEATHRLSKEFGAVTLPTRALAGIYEREKWHVDRMHPSKFGHQFIAEQFAVLLRERGYFVGAVPIDPVNNRSRKDSILWMLRNGTPWFLKRSVDLLPGLIWLSGAEIIYILRKKYSKLAKSLSDLQNDIPQELLSPSKVKI